MSSDFSANTFLDNEVGAGLQPTLALFASAGMEPPTYDSIRKWRMRDSIPAYWLARIHYALEVVEGRPLSFAKYMDEGISSCSTGKLCSSGSLPSVFD